VRSVIDDPGVEVRPVTGTLYSEPSAVSDPDGPGYVAVERAIRSVLPDVLVAPGLMVGATDSRHFRGVSDAIYRFHPAWTRSSDTERIHGVDERLRVSNLEAYVQFYAAVLREGAG